MEPGTGRAEDGLSLTMLKSDPDTLPAMSGPLFLRWPGRWVTSVPVPRPLHWHVRDRTYGQYCSPRKVNKGAAGEEASRKISAQLAEAGYRTPSLAFSASAVASMLGR